LESRKQELADKERFIQELRSETISAVSVSPQRSIKPVTPQRSQKLAGYVVVHGDAPESSLSSLSRDIVSSGNKGFSGSEENINAIEPTPSFKERKRPSVLKTRTGHDDHGKTVEVPHLVNLRIKGAENLKSVGGLIAAAPDAYLLINAIRDDKGKAKTPCFSASKSAVILKNHNPQWNEDMRSSIIGSGKICLNVFSKGSMFTAETFLGQAILDLQFHPELYDGQTMTLKLPIEEANEPIYNEEGKLVPVETVKCQGYIILTASIPAKFCNICSWFRHMKTTILGDVVGEKVWVELADGMIKIYGSPFNGVLIEEIPCRRITDVKEIMYDKLEIKIEAIEITIAPEESNKQSVVGELEALLVHETIIWAWNSDGIGLKKLWRKSFVDTHGTGIVEITTEDSN
jgi:hypothetical protein